MSDTDSIANISFLVFSFACLVAMDIVLSAAICIITNINAIKDAKDPIIDMNEIVLGSRTLIWR